MPNSTHPYDDIIDLPRPLSTAHPPMPIANRAAQFAPFAALNGFSAAVAETARLTDMRSELDSSSTDILNLKLQHILAHLTEQPEITVTYFQSDLRKSGGSYVRITGCVKKIDPYAHTLIMADQTIIPIDEIFALDSTLFDPSL